jgi:hypothetical protein
MPLPAVKSGSGLSGFGSPGIPPAQALVADSIALTQLKIIFHTLTGLQLDEVIALWLSFDDCRRRPGFTLSARSLGKIIESERGVSVELDE